MSVYSVQFQKGLSLLSFNEQFGTREKCEAFLFKQKWPNGFCCPKCGGNSASSFNKRNHTVFQCRTCHSQTSLLVNTLFQRTHLSLVKWFLGIYLVSEAKTSISSLDLHRKLDINHKSAWLMLQKIMSAMVSEEKKAKLSGRIEIDDAYLGGKLKGGKRGRGSENKQPFIAAVETDPKKHPLRIKIDLVDSFTRQEIKRWIKEHIEPDSCIVSDALDCFTAIRECGCIHEPHNSSKITVEEKECHFKWVNTILSNVKTSLSGTFHSIEVHRYAFRYLGAFIYRFNRRMDLVQIFYDLCNTVITASPITAKKLKTAI